MDLVDPDSSRLFKTKQFHVTGQVIFLLLKLPSPHSLPH